MKYGQINGRLVLDMRLNWEMIEALDSDSNAFGVASTKTGVSSKRL
jgi:hypothetical protein